MKNCSLISVTAVADYSYFGTDCEEDIGTSSHKRSGNTITVTDGEISITAEIKTLNSSMLKF